MTSFGVDDLGCDQAKHQKVGCTTPRSSLWCLLLERSPSFQQGLQAGEDRWPAMLDHFQLRAPRLEVVVRHDEPNSLPLRLQHERDLRPLLGGEFLRQLGVPL